MSLTSSGSASSPGKSQGAAAVPPAEAWPEFRFALEAHAARIEPGGTAREATAVQLPVSKNLAGVSMRLKPGGLRELHWHATAAEWAYVLSGRCRVTIFDPHGTWETLDFGPGDVWYFPRGHGHSIQGLGPDECHFMLVFDNGYFSEFGTFSVTDWIAHTPADVMAENLGLPEKAFADFPQREVYIVQAAVPPAEIPEPPPGTQRTPPLTHRYALETQQPRTFPGGSIRTVSANEFPISTTMTGASLRLQPGALRELHWHPNSDEWQYYISGRVRMTVFGSSGRASTVEFGPGDVGYVPQGYGHYLQSIGDEECHVLIVFNSGEYQEISISSWLASNPRTLLATNFGVSEELIAQLPTSQTFIAAKPEAE